MLAVKWLVFVIGLLLRPCLGSQGDGFNNTATATPNKDRGLLLDYLTAKKGHNCVCGHTNRESRLLGGEFTRIHEFPWLADIMTTTKKAGAGSLINDRFVITSATTLRGLTPYEVKVRLGVHDRCTIEKTSIVMSVDDIRLHENYDVVTKANDVALLKLGSPVVFQKNVMPVCLRSTGSLYTGQVATIVSWGQDDSDDDSNDEDDDDEYYDENYDEEKKKKKEKKLGTRTKRQEEDVLDCRPRKVGLPVLGTSQCGIWEKFYTFDKGCAGILSVPSIVCFRDAGGPVQFRNLLGVYELIGVLSSSNTCEDSNKPALYTRLTTEYLRWIAQNTRDARYCSS